ncbi:MAG: hypothetical protein Q9170_002634 [Blastenia crenularia]
MRCDDRQGSFLCYQVKPGQRRSCAALIIASAKDPDFIVLLPCYYLPSAISSNGAEAIYMPPIRPEWTLHPVPAFAREYNPYTRAQFNSVPQPKLSNPSILEPSQKGPKHSLEQVRKLYQAFSRHSERFRVEFNDVRPYLGDLKLLALGKEDLEIFIEIKSGWCSIDRKARRGSAGLKHRQGAPFPKSENGNECAFTHTNRSGISYPLLSTNEGFEEYRVDQGRSDRTVRDIERILDLTLKKSGSVKATRKNPMGLPATEAIPERPSALVDQDHGIGLVPLRQRWRTDGFQRGFGSAKHREARAGSFELWQSELLIEQCRIRGKGLILDFGVWNPICRYGILQYNWADDDKHRYDQDGEPPLRVWDVRTNISLVPLSFLRLERTGNWAPCGTRQSETQHKKIAKRPPSMVLCDLYPQECQRVQHGRFVVPSKFLYSSRRRNSRDLLQVGKGILDDFYCEGEDLIDTLTKPLWGGQQITVDQRGNTIRASEYCLDLRSVLQAGVDCVKTRHKHAPTRVSD